MSIFDYPQNEVLGTVESVDTSSVIIRVENDEKLRNLQVNHLIAIQSSKSGQHLIGLVSKIIRKAADFEELEDYNENSFNRDLGFMFVCGYACL